MKGGNDRSPLEFDGAKPRFNEAALHEGRKCHWPDTKIHYFWTLQ